MSIMLTMKMKMIIMLLDEDYGDEMMKMEIMIIMMKMKMEIMVIMLTLKMMIMIDAYYVEEYDDYYVDEDYDYYG
jgi:hypothetical protein